MKAKVTKKAPEKSLNRREAMSKAGKYVAFTSLAMISILAPKRASADSSELTRPSPPHA